MEDKHKEFAEDCNKLDKLRHSIRMAADAMYDAFEADLIPKKGDKLTKDQADSINLVTGFVYDARQIEADVIRYIAHNPPIWKNPRTWATNYKEKERTNLSREDLESIASGRCPIII